MSIADVYVFILEHKWWLIGAAPFVAVFILVRFLNR